MENNFEHIPVISQPKELKVNLYLHQLASVYEMEKREVEKFVTYGDIHVETNIGVNADKTGYGKTLSMATLIFRDKMEWITSTPYNFTNTVSLAGGRIKKTSTVTYEKIDTTLVLASHSIIHQWYDEIVKTPLAVKMITSSKSVETTLIDNYDVVLVTPTMYNRLVSKYSGFAWKRFIFDEPGHMKVPGMRKVIAGFTWLVTATPDAIIPKHRTCRISFMFDIIGCAGWQSFSQYFDYLIVKNDDDFIRFSFSMPPTEHFYHKCYNPMYKAVRGFVTSRVTEMISAGNISGAIKALGGGETNNIAELVKQKKEDELEELLSRINILTIRNKKKQVEKLEEKVLRIRGQISELDQRYKEILSGNCNICLESITDPVMEPGCQNVFCGKCLLTWLKTKNTCPLCRKNVEKQHLIYIGDSTEDKKTAQEEKRPLTKIDTIIQLLRSSPDKQFIVFSSWDQTFVPIRNILSKNDINFIEVKGAVNTRKKNIDKYKSGQIRVIFLNSKFNGAGINLQETDGIIVYHDMSNSTLDQIIGRANRLGRTEPLKVHHLQI
jgi:SNF2 family DNA or RNA helicase